jgi:hypothetical protein
MVVVGRVTGNVTAGPIRVHVKTHVSGDLPPVLTVEFREQDASPGLNCLNDYGRGVEAAVAGRLYLLVVQRDPASGALVLNSDGVCENAEDPIAERNIVDRFAALAGVAPPPLGPDPAPAMTAEALATATGAASPEATATATTTETPAPPTLTPLPPTETPVPPTETPRASDSDPGTAHRHPGANRNTSPADGHAGAADGDSHTDRDTSTANSDLARRDRGGRGANRRMIHVGTTDRLG